MTANQLPEQCGPDYRGLQQSFSKLGLWGQGAGSTTNHEDAHLNYDRLAQRTSVISTVASKQPAVAATSSTYNGHGADSGYTSQASSPRSNDRRASTMSYSNGQQQSTWTSQAIPQDLCDTFAAVKKLWADEMWRQSAKAASDPGDMAMKIKYVGGAEAPAQPYIVVHCQQAVAHIVQWFFAQRHVADKLRGIFSVHVVESAPLRLNASTAADVYKADTRDSTMCGMAIGIDSESALTSATLGGLIMVSKASGARVYGVTAGHAVDSSQPASAYSPLRYQSKRKFGAIKYTSAQHCQSSKGQNRDWALVSTRAEDWLPNSFRSSKGNGALEETTDCFYKAQVAKCVSAPHAVVITPRGVQRGSLAAHRSALLLRPGTSFVEVMDFVPDPGYGLQPGDSGAWIVDEHIGKVYGHVVSVDTFGEAYVMPIEDTLEDIRRHMDAKYAKIPNREAVQKYRERQAKPEQPAATEPAGNDPAGGLSRDPVRNSVSSAAISSPSSMAGPPSKASKSSSKISTEDRTRFAVMNARETRRPMSTSSKTQVSSITSAKASTTAKTVSTLTSAGSGSKAKHAKPSRSSKPPPPISEPSDDSNPRSKREQAGKAIKKILGRGHNRTESTASSMPVSASTTVLPGAYAGGDISPQAGYPFSPFAYQPSSEDSPNAYTPDSNTSTDATQQYQYQYQPQDQYQYQYQYVQPDGVTAWDYGQQSQYQVAAEPSSSAAAAASDYQDPYAAATHYQQPQTMTQQQHITTATGFSYIQGYAPSQTYIPAHQQ